MSMGQRSLLLASYKFNNFYYKFKLIDDLIKFS